MIKSNWIDLAGNQPFEYFFMDSYFDNLHKSESMTCKLFFLFSIIAIFIACFGLWGLATFSTHQKAKEIGIRKVQGASVSGIVFHLLSLFTKWVVIANLIAWPIGFYIMKNRLQNFAYRIDIKICYFILSGFFTLVLAAITVCYMAIMAANENPVKSLKYDY